MIAKTEVSQLLSGVAKATRNFIETTVLMRVKSLASSKADASTVSALQAIIAQQQVAILALQNRVAALETAAQSAPTRSVQRSSVVYLPT